MNTVHARAWKSRSKKIPSIRNPKVGIESTERQAVKEGTNRAKDGIVILHFEIRNMEKKLIKHIANYEKLNAELN